MAKKHFAWGSIDLRPRAELLLGWRPSPGHVKAGAVELSPDVARELGRVCTAALTRLDNMERRPYSDVLALEIGEQFAAVSTSDLPPPKAVGGGPESTIDTASQGQAHSGDDADRQLSELELIIASPGLDALSLDDVRRGRYLFYAAVGTEVGTGERIGFVRQVDPHRVARQGFLTTIFGQQGLQRLEDPVFVFEEGFDVVVSTSEIAIFRLEQFNRLFADLGPIMAAAEPNAQALGAALPSMDPDSVSALASLAATRPSVARRLQRLARPGGMPVVSPQQLRAAMKKHDIDPRLILMNTRIVFTEENAVVFLDMMEQLYYETDFTKEHRRADRHSPLS
jgi:hypothetical protein